MNALKEKISRIFARVRIKLTRPLVLALVLALVLVVGFWLGRRAGAPQMAPQEVDAETKTKAAAQVWTCSMHPQIRLPKPGLCPICNMELIPVSTGETETMTNMRQLTVSENAKKLMDIVVAPVERKFVSAVVRMIGKVDYDETRYIYILPPGYPAGWIDFMWITQGSLSVKVTIWSIFTALN